MPVIIDPKAYIIGAAEVYYRAVGGVGPWTSVGATVDDVTFRVTQTTFNPSENFNGILEPLREMDYLSKAGAEAEFTMPEFAGAKLALAIRGAQSTVLPLTDAGGTPLSTTLAAAAAIGDTAVKVTAVANAAAGDWIRVNAPGALAEYRRIDLVGTAGAGGTGLAFRDPLLKAHALGVAVVETIGDGKTEITPGTVRRSPLSAYNDWALVAQSPTDYYELLLYNALSTTDAVEITFGDESMAAIKVRLGTRRDGLNLALPSWRLRIPA
ncbi:MAG TPA: hypothetical protein VLM76_04520 [Patescibacteria group bacterium]|nr:hypothetical protein [Patescibacteria group bacterium]